METNNLLVWLKSVCNFIADSDSSNYFTLTESKTTSSMDNPDRNNNELNTAAITPENDTKTTEVVELQLHQQPNGHVAAYKSTEVTGAEAAVSNGEIQCNGLNDSVKCKHNTTTAPTPCCDIIKYKNQLCHDLKTSLINSELKSGQTVKSSKIIEAIIDVIKSRQLFSQFDPFTSKKSHNFPIAPLVTACMRSCTITGFSNVEKADSDGIIRYLGNNRFSIDCAIQIVDLRCDANYCIKLGHGKWHKRIRLRNKSFTLKMDKCLIYVELKINTSSKTIHFKRFSPISQQNVRCKTKPFAMRSLDQMFCQMLQGYFEKFLAANVLKLESQARRYLDRNKLLKYDDIVGNTALNKLFEYFPGISTGASLNSK